MNNKKKKEKSFFQIDFAKVNAKIDNKAPIFDLDKYLKPRYILQDTARLKILDRENLELVQRLNLVNRLSGKVDCYLVPNDKSYSSNLAETKVNNRIIARDNKKLLREIQAARSSYPAAELLRDWKRIEKNMEHTARYPLIWKAPGIGGDSIRRQTRPRCFFDVELSDSGESLGRMVFELYNDFCPATCANFISFCKGTEEGLSYRGTPFHRIVPKYWCQGGDVTKFNGTGGASIHADKLKGENITLGHSSPGIISAWNDATVEDGSDSKFNITFDSLPTMDGRRIVFGKVIRGLSNLYKRVTDIGYSTFAE